MATERNINRALEQRCRVYNERCMRYPYNAWSVARELQEEFVDLARDIVDELNEGYVTIESRRSSPLLASLWENQPAINLGNPPPDGYIHRLNSVLIGEQRIIQRGPLHTQLSYETPLLNVNLDGEREDFFALLAGRGIFIGAESRMRIRRNIIYEVSMYSLQCTELNASQRESNRGHQELQQISNGMAGREQNSEPLQEQDDEGNERFGMLEFD